MIRRHRRLALWGGAAAIAAGGFAFMASNAVGASSAGSGQGAVSGYAVSTISYQADARTIACPTTGSGCVSATPATDSQTYLLSVSFTLTAQGTTKAQPGHVVAYPVTGATKTPWGHSYDCSVTNWNPGTGSGTATCTFDPVPPEATVVALRVAANVGGQ